MAVAPLPGANREINAPVVIEPEEENRVAEATNESFGCLETFFSALRNSWLAISFYSFRAIEYFAPNLTPKIEAAYLYVANFFNDYFRQRTEENLQEVIANLRLECAGLTRQIEEGHQVAVERDRLRNQNEESRLALNFANERIALLEQNRQQLEENGRELQANFALIARDRDVLQDRLDQMRNRDNPLHEEIRALADERNALNQRVQIMMQERNLVEQMQNPRVQAQGNDWELVGQYIDQGEMVELAGMIVRN